VPDRAALRGAGERAAEPGGDPQSRRCDRDGRRTCGGAGLIDALARGGALDDYHLLHAARADLLRRAGRRAEAGAAYKRALALATNAAESRFLTARIAECER